MRLLYISGSGRSGSTMLERILHASPDASALGEFHCLWRLPKEQITCSCGHGFLDDPFWSAVLADACIGPGEIAEMRRLERLVSRSSFVASQGFALERMRVHPDVRHFLALQFEIFEAAARVSGKPLIIDSSKAGPRAWILACDPRTHFIHLYRHPEDVIASWRSRKFDKGIGAEMQRLSVGRAALDWWKSEHFARMLGRQRRVAMLSYDAFCQQPQSILTEALSFARIDGLRQPDWADHCSVRQGKDYHSLNGNPDRFNQGSLQIVARNTDWSKYPLPDRISSKLLGGALATFYRPLIQESAAADHFQPADSSGDVPKQRRGR
jgi:Sulfotransferase family